VSEVAAHAKLNLSLVVGPRRDDGKHELVTVMQRIGVVDWIEVKPGRALHVFGFHNDTLVREALQALADAVGVEPRWQVRIEKEIPVAAGLGGGSSDAATALVLANESLPQPLPAERLHELAAKLGADVPFFLTPGPKLAEGDGTTLRPLRLPLAYTVLLLVPQGVSKRSTGAVYERFDARSGERGFEERRASLLDALERVERAEDLARNPRDELARLPRNDLASSCLAGELERLGAFRADVTGAGPAVYGLFSHAGEARAAMSRLAPYGAVWITEPAW
jgi:4-diphosphocytidyl-2-C-methyl-D-erythritol kinase